MTAPGNSALLIALLAVFVACSAYAAGRLHQRYQMERDREEAYRDGYDTATRSVFSLAARVIAPRRAVRGSAPALPAAAPGSVSGPSTPSGLTPPGAAPMPGVGGAMSGRAPLSGDLVVANGGAMPDGTGASDGHGMSAGSHPEGGVAASGGAAVQAGPGLPGDAAAGSAAWPSPGFAGLLGRAAVPGTTAAPTAMAADGSESLGFPVPPPPPPRVVVEPAAVGGVVYRPFPDPRVAADPSAGSGLPADAGPPAAPEMPGSAAAARSTASPADCSASAGRHTVPDELVQAATYRLPPDRVFRAKVPDAALPDEPTTRLSVPKPRQS